MNWLILLVLITACTKKPPYDLPSDKYNPAPESEVIPKFKFEDLVVVKKSACEKRAYCIFYKQSSRSLLIRDYNNFNTCKSKIEYTLSNTTLWCEEDLELAK